MKGALGCRPRAELRQPAQRMERATGAGKMGFSEALSDVSGEAARRGGEDWCRLHSKGSHAWGSPVGQPGGRGATKDDADVCRRDSGDGGEDRVEDG